MGGCSPIYCYEGVGQAMAWSPSGAHLLVTDRYKYYV